MKRKANKVIISEDPCTDEISAILKRSIESVFTQSLMNAEFITSEVIIDTLTQLLANRVQVYTNCDNGITIHIIHNLIPSIEPVEIVELEDGEFGFVIYAPKVLYYVYSSEPVYYESSDLSNTLECTRFRKLPKLMKHSARKISPEIVNTIMKLFAIADHAALHYYDAIKGHRCFRHVRRTDEFIRQRSVLDLVSHTQRCETASNWLKEPLPDE